MTDLIHKLTVRNFSPCDHLLNLWAHGKKDGAQRAIQLLSYFTHPTDILIQAVAYPAFRLINPFITMGINCANGDWDWVAASVFTIPVKEIVAVAAILNFEGKQGIRLIHSLLGLNTLSNVENGKKQTNAFFLKRVVAAHNVEAERENRKKQSLTPKKVYQIMPIPDEFKSLNREEAISDLCENHSWSNVKHKIKMAWNKQSITQSEAADSLGQAADKHPFFVPPAAGRPTGQSANDQFMPDPFNFDQFNLGQPSFGQANPGQPFPVYANPNRFCHYYGQPPLGQANSDQTDPDRANSDQTDPDQTNFPRSTLEGLD